MLRRPRGVCVIRTRSAGAGPFLIIGIRGRCLFSGDYGVSGPGAWPGSHLGLDAPFLTLSALEGGDSLPTVMHRLPPARGHRERLRPGVLWGDRGGPPRGVTSPGLPSEPTSSLHASPASAGPLGGSAPGQHGGLWGPASSDPASGLASAAGREGSGPHGTHACFHRSGLHPEVRQSVCTAKAGQGLGGLPFTASCENQGGEVPCDLPPASRAPARLLLPHPQP